MADATGGRRAGEYHLPGYRAPSYQHLGPWERRRTLSTDRSDHPAPYAVGRGIQLTKGNKLGVKVNGGAGTVAGYFTGDYVY